MASVDTAAFDTLKATLGSTLSDEQIKELANKLVKEVGAGSGTDAWAVSGTDGPPRRNIKQSQSTMSDDPNDASLKNAEKMAKAVGRPPTRSPSRGVSRTKSQPRGPSPAPPVRQDDKKDCRTP